ncbi:MAG: hypothetical protein JNN03_11120 [Rubrivivax sp.]|nr:hypothetical protein [Rubrivivax sp.]
MTQSKLAEVSGFDQWDAARYLAHYYAEVEADEAATLAFITRACGRIGAPGRALVFGVGPTVHHLLPLAPHVRELHVADYLDSNLEHVRRWLRRDSGAHDWRAFGRHVLRGEGACDVGEAAVAQRERLVRARVTRCLLADAAHERPLFMSAASTREAPRYDVVLSCFCAESATGDKAVWRRYVRNIVRLLAPGGLFITAALRRCTAYRVGSAHFASADIDEHELTDALLAAGVEGASLEIEVHRVGLRERLGYDSIVLAAAATRGAPAETSRVPWFAEPAPGAAPRSRAAPTPVA